jgi:branched-subunit amino acid transport protein
MSLLVLVLTAALVTYLSRVAALVFFPTPTGVTETILRRLPGPLFAGLAVATLVGTSGSPPPVPMIVAVVAAVAVAPRRSLGLCLVAGIAGYGVAATLTGW